MTFEQFLEERCGSHTNNSPEGFERWLEQLDTQEVMDYAEIYGKMCFLDGKIEGLNIGKQIMKGADENDILKEYKEKE